MHYVLIIKRIICALRVQPELDGTEVRGKRSRAPTPDRYRLKTSGRFSFQFKCLEVHPKCGWAATTLRNPNLLHNRSFGIIYSTTGIPLGRSCSKGREYPPNHSIMTTRLCKAEPMFLRSEASCANSAMKPSVTGQSESARISSEEGDVISGNLTEKGSTVSLDDKPPGGREWRQIKFCGDPLPAVFEEKFSNVVEMEHGEFPKNILRT